MSKDRGTSLAADRLAARRMLQHRQEKQVGAQKSQASVFRNRWGTTVASATSSADYIGNDDSEPPGSSIRLRRIALMIAMVRLVVLSFFITFLT